MIALLRAAVAILAALLCSVVSVDTAAAAGLSYTYDGSCTSSSETHAPAITECTESSDPMSAALPSVTSAEAATGVAAEGGASGADLLAGQADTLVSGDLTAAGRALAKHGGRPGSAFPAAAGSQSAISDQAGATVRDILDNQTRRVEFYNPRLKTQVVDIYGATGRGIRYSKDGDFIGFLEPPR